MRGREVFLMFLVVALCAVTARPAEAAFNPERWEKYSSISQGDSTSGYALIELSPAIYHLASPDLRDLRVIRLVSGQMEELPYDIVLYKSEDYKTERQIKMNIVNREIITKEKSEAIIMTSGFDNLRLNSLAFSVDSANFSRDITILGSQDMKEWSYVSEGTLELLNLSQTQQRTLSVPVNSPGYRYLKVVIRNGDNPPLKISDVNAKFSPYYLLFQCKQGGSYHLYLSNGAAKAPEYDLAKLSEKIMTTRPPLWSVSNPQDNPLFKAEPVKVPESEKQKWLLPGILAVLVAVLAIFIIKSLPHITKKQ